MRCFNIFKKKQKIEKKPTEIASNVISYPFIHSLSACEHFKLSVLCRYVYEPRHYFKTLLSWLDKDGTEIGMDKEQVEELRTSAATMIKDINDFLTIYHNIRQSLLDRKMAEQSQNSDNPDPSL